MRSGKIIIKGAREHNLKNLNLEIPRNKLVVITGLSGSGKSSLAFDTIYAEGQRRYVESLSTYARQFLEQMDKPDVDSIEGLSPAISIEQKSISKNPRSTVGTITEIYDYLRLLMARVGTAHCYKCGKEISSQTIHQMVDRIMELPKGARVLVLAPVVRGRKGEYRKELGDLSRRGYLRVRVDGQVRNLDEEITLDKRKKHDIEVVVDRLVIKPDLHSRLADSLETALSLTEDIVLIHVQDGEEMLFSERFACTTCGISYPEISPRMFSFNSPHGACETCNGLGTSMEVDPDLVVPDPSLSIREGAIRPWANRNSTTFFETLHALEETYRFDFKTPFKDLKPEVQKVLLYGSGEKKLKFYYERDGRRRFFHTPFKGVVPTLRERYRESESSHVLEKITEYISESPCTDCKGARLRPECLSITVGGRHIGQITRMSVKKALEFFVSLNMPPRDMEIAERIIKELRDRLSFLSDVGLDYLTLDRSARTLSGGEGQRIKLATQIGSSLVGVLYILDEPSIGLHQRDNLRLLATLRHLQGLGNTVIVVEHDRDTILSSDYVIDLGPGAGERGGYLVSSGTPPEITNRRRSLTGKYLSGEMNIEVPQRRRKSNGKFIELKNCAHNNLKDIDVEIPLGLFTCITGVSGSGKSSLLLDILYLALKQKLYRSPVRPGEFKEIRGVEHVDKAIDIDQSPIGRTPRSNPATYIGLFTGVRELFSKTPLARARGYKPGRFSFNVKGGRCEACKGDGTIKIEMHFLPNVYVRCELCKGSRFNRETLDIEFKGRNIAQVLQMTVTQAMDFFANLPGIQRVLKTVHDVGLGYIRLGQPATTLSGGEAQRVKLAKELGKRSTGRTLYILDEPTTGLHFDDIKKLLEVLNRLVDAGNTVLVIEHNMEVIKTADHVIDLGPEGGEKGGHIVAVGSPEKLAASRASYTGRYLHKTLHPTGDGTLSGGKARAAAS